MENSDYIREVDLLGYLPQYLKSYKELKEVFKVEEPEIVSLFKELGVIRANQYICTADELGIDRFEGILGLLVNKNEDLETRRARVLVKWLEDIPYTFETLVVQLESLCGVDGFEMTLDNESYYLEVLVRLAALDRFSEVQSLLSRVVPCNLTVNAFVDFNKYKLFKPFMYKEIGKFTFKELREKVINVDDYLHRFSDYIGETYGELGVFRFGELRRKGEWFSE